MLYIKLIQSIYTTGSLSQFKTVFLSVKSVEGYCVGLKWKCVEGHPQVSRQVMPFGHIATSILRYYILG